MAWSDAARAAALAARMHKASITRYERQGNRGVSSPTGYDFRSRMMYPMPGRDKSHQFVNVHGLDGSVQRSYYAHVLKIARQQAVRSVTTPLRSSAGGRRDLTYVIAGRMLQSGSGRR